MIKKSYTIPIFVLMFILTLGSSRTAWAQACPYAGWPCTSAMEQGQVSAIQGVVEAAIEAAEQSIGEAIKSMRKALNKKIDNVENAIVKAANGVSATVSSSAELEMTAHQKTLDAYKTKKVKIMERTQHAKVAIRNQPSATACIKITENQYKPESQMLNKATSDRLALMRKNDLNNMRGETAIERQARLYQTRTTVFDDRNLRNHSPNATNGELAAFEKGPNLLLDEGTLSQEALPAVDVVIDSINPVNAKKTALPELRTASGQRRYVADETKKVRKAMIDGILTKMAADRLPTSNTGDQQLAMWRHILGDNAPAELLDYYDQNQADQVSEASKREIARISFMAFQSSLDHMSLTEGGASWKTVEDLARVVEMEYQGLLADERKNILLSLQYADMIN